MLDHDVDVGYRGPAAAAAPDAIELDIVTRRAVADAPCRGLEVKVIPPTRI